MDMDICPNSEFGCSFPLNSIYDYNNSFLIEFENYCDSNKRNDLLFRRNKDTNQNTFPLITEYENPFMMNQNKNELSIDEATNIKKINFLKNNKNNSNINKEINLTSLDTNNPKSNQISEIGKELPPKFFPENSINVIIRNYDITKEMKLKLLLNINTKNNDIEQIKRVLESDTKKRRKTYNNSLYRTDHILTKLINIMNLSLLSFINNLIAALYSKEKIYQILNGTVLFNTITQKDLKEVIKKNDYIFRGKLETREEKLNLLNLTLKKYFSEKISPKYNKLKYPSNYNELIIEKLLKDETNKDIFDFILNDLLIKDWLEIFLYKIDLKDFDKYNSFDKTKKNIIKENIERIDKYIDKIYKSDKIYFHCFSLIAYNLNRFLLIKEKRNKNKNEEKENLNSFHEQSQNSK